VARLRDGVGAWNKPKQKPLPTLGSKASKKSKYRSEGHLPLKEAQNLEEKYSQGEGAFDQQDLTRKQKKLPALKGRGGPLAGRGGFTFYSQ